MVFFPVYFVDIQMSCFSCFRPRRKDVQNYDDDTGIRSAESSAYGTGKSNGKGSGKKDNYIVNGWILWCSIFLLFGYNWVCVELCNHVQKERGEQVY